MLLTFFHSMWAALAIDLGLRYFLVFASRRLGVRTLEVYILGNLALFAALAGLQGPTQMCGLLALLFFGYMIIIRDKLVATRKR